MKLFRKVCMSVFVMSLVISAVPAFADLKLSGYVHSDWGYLSLGKNDSRPYVDFQVRYNLSTRKELPSGVFIEAFGQVRAQVQGTQADQGFSTGAGVRDAWVQVGNKTIALKLGRFEKTDVVRRGEEILLAPVKSAAENIRYRVLLDSAMGRSQGDIALTYTFSDACKFELGGVWFPSEFKAISTTPAQDMGVRPVFKYETASLLFVVGGEFRHRATQDSNEDKTARDTTAAGGTIEKRFGKLAIGVAGGIRHDHTKGAAGTVLGNIDSSMISGYVDIPVGKADRIGVYGGYTKSDLKAKDPSAVSATPKRGVAFGNFWYFHPNFLSLDGTELGIGGGYTKAGRDEDERGFCGIIRFTYRF
jgi:hypothetical protein